MLGIRPIPTNKMIHIKKLKQIYNHWERERDYRVHFLNQELPLASQHLKQLRKSPLVKEEKY